MASEVTPKRVAIFLSGVDTGEGELEEVISQVAEGATSRGLFFDWAAIGDMDISDVIPNSPLHQALTGNFPDR